MEESDDLDEDVQGEGKPTVLWERCIQQSIVFELSEDESLHLSDLESSLGLHLSQAESTASEANIHLSGSADLSELDESSSESSVARSNSVNAVKDKSKSITANVSAQRPNTMNDESSFKQAFEDPGQNTSDEEQEDLPYDDGLGSPYFNQPCSSLGNLDRGNVFNRNPNTPELPEKEEKTNTKWDEAPPCPLSTDIPHLLLRHFSKEEDLLRPERLIETETLPEVSLLESVDESVFSSTPKTNRLLNSSGERENTQERRHNATTNESLDEEPEKKTEDFSLAETEKNTSSSGSVKQRIGTSADETEQHKTKEDDPNQRVPLIRTRSFTEMKYGQGQVHYPLPDFSKVAPKVKIPKAPSGPVRPVLQSPNTIHRVQSSPGMLELISRVLEDSVPPYVFKDSESQTPPAVEHHLKTEYGKLSTRYAESESFVDQMKPESNNPPSSDDPGKELKFSEETNSNYLVSPPTWSENLVEKRLESMQPPVAMEANRVLSNPTEDVLSDGERMTAELKDIIVQFMQKVEEFKCNVTNMAVSTAEQQMMLRSMMEAQDELERKYISKKDEHRALEMQNYMGLSRNTGTFDPDRLVEGDIFRIGMHLEDIKEVIDRNTYKQISPPHSSSTPTSIRASPPPKIDSLCFHKRSPPPAPSLYEGKSFLTSFKEEAHKGEDEGEVDDLSEVQELGTMELKKEIVDETLDNSHELTGSEKGLLSQTAEDEQETSSGLSDGTDHREFLASLSGTRSPSNWRQWTTDSVVLNTSSECELGDGVSLAVEVSCSHPPRDNHSTPEPVANTSCLSQRIVCPETDSGFGSSCLHQSATEAFQSNALTGSVRFNCEALSNSDSEASSSNLETAIHAVGEAAHPSIQTKYCEAAAAVELWVECTTKEPSVRLQADQTHPALPWDYISEPTLSSSMGAMDNHSPLNSCSCNSEAILALQTEVSKLKRDLEQGLVQLPHLTQRMDCLISKYRQEDLEHRSKIQTDQTSASKSLRKSCSRSRSDLTSSLFRMKDSISSDKELRKTRATVGTFNEQHLNQRPQAIKDFNFKERLYPSLQKPLLQVNYGSSCSLPASYKVRELHLQSTSFHRKHSTQSDTALLPSNVYFQQTLSASSAPVRDSYRRRAKKEEDINRTLDQAIEVARIMKRTTDHMARRLSADLAKAKLHKKLPNMYQ
ncbi:uncharacterized protein LOC119772987 isoform X2 [Cyprinodon tularosa]|uniref:uncharacterized protein LOC119772987 isoform X2 n=1 Tax=Cyprinodon tularosa TaxID=77115 RepID=UPI0018E211D7|nr:uncharacterized protein LOC119772987 isoform X2 [Cyprinodon tularosa]